MTLPLGGDAATAFFTPLEVTGTVRKVGGGVIELADNHQREVDMGVYGDLRGRPGDPADQRAARRRRQRARRLPRLRHRARRLQDGGAEDRVELPVFRADHLAGHPRRHARAWPVGHSHPAVAANSAPDLSARSDRGLARALAGAQTRSQRRKGSTSRDRTQIVNSDQEVPSHEVPFSSPIQGCSGCSSSEWRR